MGCSCRHAASAAAAGRAGAAAGAPRTAARATWPTRRHSRSEKKLASWTSSSSTCGATAASEAERGGRVTVGMGLPQCGDTRCVAAGRGAQALGWAGGISHCALGSG